MHIYLVRHGQTAWNALNRAQGHSDIPLDEVGRRQAEQLRLATFAETPSAIYTSDLSRARQTAEPVAHKFNLELVADERLRERSMGDWEGRDFADVHVDFERLTRPDDPLAIGVRPPNGESILDVWDRLELVVTEIVGRQQTSIIVSHGAACALILGQLLGSTPEVARSFRFSNTSVTELKLNSRGRFALLRYDCTRHLDEDVPSLAGSIDGNESKV